MSLNNEEESKTPQIIIGILLFNIIVLHIFLFFLIYIPYSEGIINVFIFSEYSFYLLLTIILIIIRIFILSYLSYSFLYEWNSHKSRFMGFHFLFGLHFYLVIICKSIDIIVFTMNTGYEYFPNELTLNLYKIRQFIAILAMLPLIIIETHLFFYNRNLKKEAIIKNKNIEKKVKIVLIICILGGIFIIFLATSTVFLLLIFIVFNLVYLWLIWIFFKAYKGKILPEINCFIVGIGFIVLFVAGYIPSFFIFVLLGTSVYGILIGTLIAEILSLISYIIILIGFKTKPNY